VRDNVTIAYRGASYEIGRGPSFYGIWAIDEPDSQALEWWADSPEGWYAAWARFVALEAPGTIVPVAPPVDQPAPAVVQPNQPLYGFTASDPHSAMPVGHYLEPATEPDAPDALANRVAQATTPPSVAAAGPGGRGVLAAALLAIGVACGIAGLFPDYLNGTSLAHQSFELAPHVIYLATWSASALLILFGRGRLRFGALLAAGTSIVTFGFFFADLGTPISAGAHLMGAGLVLSLVGWLCCFAGSMVAFALRRQGDALRKPAGPEFAPFIALTLAALGAAAAFAPAWDSYVLQTAAGTTDTITAGNVFSNPAAVIAGNLAVMVSLVAVVVAAALWRPIVNGAVLLAGALIPMVAQAVSAVIQIGQPTPPSTFGISSKAAAQAGLTITSGLTLAFWIYCIFLVALALMSTSAVFAQRSAARVAAMGLPTSAAGHYATGTRPPEFPSDLSPLGPVAPKEP
jgi:hypothetical protein